MRAADVVATPDPAWDPAAPDPGTSSAPFRIYNIGNGAPVELLDFIAALERALGRPAVRELLPLQPGDVPDTWADCAPARGGDRLAALDPGRGRRRALRRLVPRVLRPVIRPPAGRARFRRRRPAGLRPGRASATVAGAMGRSAGSIEGEPFGAVVPAPAGYPPAYVRAVIAEAAEAGLVPLARARRPHDPRTPALVAVVRDEAARLPGFLAHYRRLGVTRFAIIDHGSRDATRALLAAEADVELFAADRPFPGKQGWVNALIARMGYDRWYLHVDADERLVFDGAGVGDRPGRGLADLIGFAEARGLRRLRGMLVDLYPPGPLLAPEARDPMRAPAPGGPLFDADGYPEALCLERVSRKGGPRRRAFGFDPELTKYPLFHVRAGEVVSSPHHLHPYPENYRSDCFLGLLHDKFGPGFIAKAERAAAEGNYWRESLEYRRDARRARARPRARARLPRQPALPRALRPGRRRADRADPLGRPAAAAAAASPAGAAAAPWRRPERACGFARAIPATP